MAEKRFLMQLRGLQRTGVSLAGRPHPFAQTPVVDGASDRSYFVRPMHGKQCVVGSAGCAWASSRHPSWSIRTMQTQRHPPRQSDVTLGWYDLLCKSRILRCPNESTKACAFEIGYQPPDIVFDESRTTVSCRELFLLLYFPPESQTLVTESEKRRCSWIR
jgi:hypothetical protein